MVTANVAKQLTDWFLEIAIFQKSVVLRNWIFPAVIPRDPLGRIKRIGTSVCQRYAIVDFVGKYDDELTTIRINGKMIASESVERDGLIAKAGRNLAIGLIGMLSKTKITKVLRMGTVR